MTVRDIRDRVRRNEPRRVDPERFHIEKSDIAGLCTDVLTALGERQ